MQASVNVEGGRVECARKIYSSYDDSSIVARKISVIG